MLVATGRIYARLPKKALRGRFCGTYGPICRLWGSAFSGLVVRLVVCQALLLLIPLLIRLVDGVSFDLAAVSKTRSQVSQTPRLLPR